MIANKLIADIHCIEPIPCNPCETSCPFGAITIGSDITNLPVVHEDLCRGCGICLAVCPGLAIRLLQMDNGNNRAIVAFPYEYHPLPQKGDLVTVVNMEGLPLGQGTVTRLQKPIKNDPTQLVFVEVDPSIAQEVRSMERLKDNDLEEELIICRCEEVTRKEILNAIQKGDHSLDAVKRRTRAGMGLCQGKSCSKLVSRMICEQTNITPDQLAPASKRQPVNPISLKTMASTSDKPLFRDLDALARELDNEVK